jgi:hypothetical protein
MIAFVSFAMRGTNLHPTNRGFNVTSAANGVMRCAVMAKHPEDFSVTFVEIYHVNSVLDCH